jgi:hypothetical protein
MKIKASIHMNDAVTQMANAASLRNPERWDEKLLRYARKWDIKKTLIKTFAGGVKDVIYLDSKGEWVVDSLYYYLNSRGEMTTKPIIGELIETTEDIELIYER